MINLYIEGFHGPWGWVDEFYSTTNSLLGNIKCVSTPSDADVIFQCDPSNWKNNIEFIGKKFVIANVLDYAHWCGGNNDIEEYSKHFVSRSNIKCGISNDVIERMNSRGIDNVTLFHYPSQVDRNIIDYYKQIPKKNVVISFCRLADPGKRISESTVAFLESDLPMAGWKYFLIGPEVPALEMSGHGIKYMGYFDKNTLYGIVASSMATIMPSDGEGLGLPAIESILVGTKPIVRNIEPMKSVLGDSSLYFNTRSELVTTLNGLIDCIHCAPPPVDNSHKLYCYERYAAFDELLSLINKIELEKMWKK